MHKSGFGPLIEGLASKFEDIATLRSHYGDIKNKPAFKDFIHRITQARDGMENNLVRGDGLDKFGICHDNEIRAVLHCLNTILGYIPAIEKDFRKAEANIAKMPVGGATDPTRGITAPDWDYW